MDSEELDILAAGASFCLCSVPYLCYNNSTAEGHIRLSAGLLLCSLLQQIVGVACYKQVPSGPIAHTPHICTTSLLHLQLDQI